MLFPVVDKLNKLKVVLGSTSPRRIEMLQKMSLKVIVQGSDFAEDLDREAYSPENFVMLTAQGKTVDVFEKIPDADIVIGSDTMIIAPQTSQQESVKNVILGKPLDEEDAKATLRRLSNREHHVVSGVSMLVRLNANMLDIMRERVAAYDTTATVELWGTDMIKMNFYGSTAVRFDSLDEDTIAAYVATGEPMDKAGAYGIQGLGGSLVREIQGCYYNVMGLPINKLSQMLRIFVSVLENKD
jgi:septum formation protein